MNIDELKEKIISGEIHIDSPNSSIISRDQIKNNITQEIKIFEIRKGHCTYSSILCDKLWGEEIIKIYEEIKEKKISEEELKEVLENAEFEDDHWDWFLKHLAYSGKREYEWFYLYIDDKPQAACLIFQPDDGALGNSPIFYVEFIAVAPWNRDIKKLRNRQYKGLGAILLNRILRFLTSYGLNPGFSLHSLPAAEPFYTKLKMISVPSKVKDGLMYYELPRTEAQDFLGI